mgnify:CR=1 FL=1
MQFCPPPSLHADASQAAHTRSLAQEWSPQSCGVLSVTNPALPMRSVFMILLILAYLGGVLTIASPCILPVLPFVFSRADRPFRRNGLPMLIGMGATFALVASLAAVGGACQPVGPVRGDGGAGDGGAGAAGADAAVAAAGRLAQSAVGGARRKTVATRR